MYRQQNGVSDFVHLPAEAFLFRPFHSGSARVRDDFKIGEGKRIRRLLFDGWAEDTYTAYEVEQLERLEQHLEARGVRLDERWDRPWRLRYLLSTGCELERCVADMLRFEGYAARVKELHLGREVARLLGEGVFYVMGRDCHYRPLLVFDAERLVRLRMSEEELQETQIYFFEYVIRHYFIPGQVENWVALVDSGYQGLFQMKDTMQKAFGFLSDTYRSRLFAGYNVRITTSISIIWGIVKRFLEPETVEKINLFDENVPHPLFEYAHPSQIEQKFGGTMPDIPAGSYWPPREWSTTYRLEKCPVNYMSREEYTELFSSGTLRNTKIHEENLILPTSTELRDNQELLALKRMEKEFKLQLEATEEDRLLYEKDIEPYAKLPLPPSYSALLERPSAKPPQK